MDGIDAVGRFFAAFKDLPPGLVGLVIAACFGIIWIGQGMRRDKQESKLVTQLQASLDAAHAALLQSGKAASDDRHRADRISSEMMQLVEQASRNNALLEMVGQQLAQVSTTKEALEKKVASMEAAMERLVMEVRNKDISINELVRLNRQLLHTLPRQPTVTSVDNP